MGSIVLQVNGSTVGNVADGAGIEIKREVTDQDSTRLIAALADYYKSHFVQTSPDGPKIEKTIRNIIEIWWADVIRQALKHVERYEARQKGPFSLPVTENGAPVVPVEEKPITFDQVNAERDRRMATVMFDGKLYDTNTSGLASLALAAIMNGAQPGDLRWSDPDTDFAWVSLNNERTPMDAQTCWAFTQTAEEHKKAMILKASNLKDMNPIPRDYTASSYWT
jgi:hypothetical protein